MEPAPILTAHVLPERWTIQWDLVALRQLMGLLPEETSELCTTGSQWQWSRYVAEEILMVAPRWADARQGVKRAMRWNQIERFRRWLKSV